MKRVERSKITVDVAKFRRCEISSYPGNAWHQHVHPFSNMNEFRTLAMGLAVYDSQRGKEWKVRQLASMGLHIRGGGWKHLDSKATAQKDGTALASRMLIGARFFFPRFLTSFSCVNGLKSIVAEENSGLHIFIFGNLHPFLQPACSHFSHTLSMWLFEW